MRSSELDAKDLNEYGVISEAARRDEELSAGKIAGRTHEEVMEAGRAALHDSRVAAKCS